MLSFVDWILVFHMALRCRTSTLGDVCWASVGIRVLDSMPSYMDLILVEVYFVNCLVTHLLLP